ELGDGGEIHLWMEPSWVIESNQTTLHLELVLAEQDAAALFYFYRSHCAESLVGAGHTKTFRVDSEHRDNEFVFYSQWFCRTDQDIEPQAVLRFVVAFDLGFLSARSER